MKRSKRVSLGKYLKKHGILIVLITLVIGISLGFTAWYSHSISTQLANNSATLAQFIKDTDTKIHQSIERKEAEAAQQKLEAQKAAEQAKTSGASGSTAINPKACNASSAHNNPASIDVVVNKKHCIQPLGYVPSDITTIYSATLSSKASGAFQKMYTAAAQAGQPFYVTSSYRSYAMQVTTYNRWISISGQEAADTYSARPGYSEHQTGFAFDVAANGCTLDCFGSTSQYGWFQQHAAEYGFIQRYYKGSESVTGYKAEEWHYRYVGVEVAMDMKNKGVKTLEQYWGIEGGTY